MYSILKQLFRLKLPSDYAINVNIITFKSGTLSETNRLTLVM